MPLNDYINPPLFAALVGLCGALIFCETMRAQADSDAIQAQEAVWNCWTLESGKVPRCRERGLEDVNDCDEAVLACKASGEDEHASEAVERDLMWTRISAWLRLVLLVAFLGLLAWMGLAPPIRRVMRPRSRQ